MIDLYAIDENQRARSWHRCVVASDVKREIAGTALSSFATNTLLNTPVLSSFSRRETRRVYPHLRMLALPLYPTPLTSHQPPQTVSQCGPAKDIESFNKLLPPVVEFVEGSSSGTLLIGEGRYEPVNGSPKSPAASEVPSPSHRCMSSHVPCLDTSTCSNNPSNTPGSYSSVTVVPSRKEERRSLFWLGGDHMAQRIDCGLRVDQHWQ